MKDWLIAFLAAVSVVALTVMAVWATLPILRAL